MPKNIRDIDGEDGPFVRKEELDQVIEGLVREVETTK